MFKPKICDICGNEFIPHSNRQRSCGETKVRKCEWCGQEFEYICNHEHSKTTCSKQCQAQLIKRKRIESASKLSRNCKWCGKKFTPKSVRDAYCNEPHYQTCSVCGKRFEIDVRKDKTVKTCSARCRYLSTINNRNIDEAISKQRETLQIRYGVDNPMRIPGSVDKIKSSNREKYGTDWYTQTDEYKNRVKHTSQEKYGVDHFLSAESVKQKRYETCKSKYGSQNIFSSEFGRSKVREQMRKKYGVDNPSQYLEFKRKATANSRNSKLEAKICDLFNNYGIEYVNHHIIKKNDMSHEFDFFLPKYNILLDADGLYYHSYLDDPNGKQVLDYYDDIRVSLVPEDHMFFLIIEGTQEQQVKQIVDILSKIDSGVFDYDSFLFDWCRSIEFPYPTYENERMMKDYSNLCKYENDKYVPQCRIGESIIKQYHRSIYSCRKRGSLSPIDVWNDDDKLKKVIRNRLIYANDVDPSKILRGFNVSRIGQVVSIFNPILAKYALSKYAVGDDIFDPFSGFSGRMLGAASLGMKYTGQDSHELAVKESNEIIKFLNLTNCEITHVENSLKLSGTYSTLFTCPPYSDKEIYSDELDFRSCDDWISELVRVYHCDRYIFVVDETTRYKDFIVEEIKSTSHFADVSEYIVVI